MSSVAKGADERDWSGLRARVRLDSESVNLNAGSFSPLPAPVDEALGALRRRLAEAPSDFHWRRTPPLLDRARDRLAAFLDADPDDFLLLPNTTFAINLVARSLKLPADSEILTTDQEYGAMRFCWERKAAAEGLILRTAPIPILPDDPEQIVTALRGALTERTRLLFFSHVTSPTGLVLPAQALGRMAAESGVISVVDGAHAPGMIPLRLNDLSVDFYAGNCHKWLMAPAGAAFLHAGPVVRHHLQPLITSWGWEYDPKRAREESGWGSSYWARNLEFHGTLDRCPLMVLPEVLDFRAEIGDAPIARRVAYLVAYARRRIADLGFAPATPDHPDLAGAMTAFAMPPIDLIRARDWIWNAHRIEAPFSAATDRHFLRVSTAWYNTTDEIDRLTDALRSIPLDDLAP